MSSILQMSFWFLSSSIFCLILCAKLFLSMSCLIKRKHYFLKCIKSFIKAVFYRDIAMRCFQGWTFGASFYNYINLVNVKGRLISERERVHISNLLSVHVSDITTLLGFFQNLSKLSGITGNISLENGRRASLGS